MTKLNKYINGAGYAPEIEDVPNNYEEDTINNVKELLPSLKGLVNRRHDTLSRRPRGQVESHLSTN